MVRLGVETLSLLRDPDKRDQLFDWLSLGQSAEALKALMESADARGEVLELHAVGPLVHICRT